MLKLGANTPLNQQSGSVPIMTETLLSWFQSMIFNVVTKTNINFQVKETKTATPFLGVVQPLTTQALMLKPEGQRAWKWLMVHSEPSLQLRNDDQIEWLSNRYRVKNRSDYTLYGYMYYELVEDFTGGDPV